MGLDCYWHLPGREVGEGLAIPEEGRLCGGMFSGAWTPVVLEWVHPEQSSYDWGYGGEPYAIYGEPRLVGGSFRGKVYADLVADVGGHSLYSHQSPAQVGETATALERAVEAGQHPHLEEIKLLAVVFRAYARAGAGLIASY